jgi:CRISPR/Cas system-associated endonuclease Cas1
MTKNLKPIAVLRSLDDDEHIKTRICQYEAMKNGKGVQIAKQIVYSKIESQNRSLNSNNLKDIRKRLMPIEGKATEFYFRQIFQLLPKNLRVEKRKSWKVFDGVNNTFNLAYTMLKYRFIQQY